jgi:hypothetical protein
MIFTHTFLWFLQSTPATSKQHKSPGHSNDDRCMYEKLIFLKFTGMISSKILRLFTAIITLNV